MFLEQRCLLAEPRFLVECHQAVEKAFFWQRALQNPRKRTLREAPFISYANLERTWRATDSTVPPGSGTMSMVLGPCLLCWFLTGWISIVLFLFFSQCWTARNVAVSDYVVIVLGVASVDMTKQSLHIYPCGMNDGFILWLLKIYI